MNSPFEGLAPNEWEAQTRSLIAQHPLPTSVIKEVVLASWVAVFDSGIGTKPFRIGVEIFPRPQIMAFFLHELIPLELSHRYPTQWKREESVGDKDIVCISDPLFSIEIKASSNPRKIFGNRSYVQPAEGGKKGKSGYYLAINFEPFQKIEGHYVVGVRPRIVQIRFGWLDATDWVGQTAASGQQARLKPEADRYKLLPIPL